MRLFFIFIVSVLTNLTCQAGAFSVTPVRLFFEPKDRAIALTLMNEGDEEIILQADVHRWTQNAEGLDTLEFTDDLIVSPPHLRLPPRSKQVVRLGLLIPRDPSQQMTYRLVIREIPEALPLKGEALQLPIALVLNMPIFITPQGAKRHLDCEWNPGKGPAASLSCTNTGSAYAQVRDAEIKRNGNLLAKSTGGTYILPGARKDLPLEINDRLPIPSGLAELVLVCDDLKPEISNFDIP